MPNREVTYRQIQTAQPALACILQGDGAFAHLDDLELLRYGRLHRECEAQMRACRADMSPIHRRYQKTRKVPTGVGEDGEPKFENRPFVPADDRWDYERAVEDGLDEVVSIDVPVLTASKLRRPLTEEERKAGQTEPRIPTGWCDQFRDGEKIDEPLRLSPGQLLAALEPFLEMDLETEPA